MAFACTNLRKEFCVGGTTEEVLKDITVSFNPGECSLLLGPSGSGKTTLLSILGFLLTPTKGEVLLHGGAVDFHSRDELTSLRRKHIGFVFQHSHLLPFLTAEENLKIIAQNAGAPKDLANERIQLLSQRLGLRSFLRKNPGELSGGQRQRAAIARAIMNKPAVILADEPTAALDWHNAEAALGLLVEEARAEKAVLIVVSHDTRLTPYFDRILALENGRLL